MVSTAFSCWMGYQEACRISPGEGWNMLKPPATNYSSLDNHLHRMAARRFLIWLMQRAPYELWTSIWTNLRSSDQQAFHQQDEFAIICLCQTSCIFSQLSRCLSSGLDSSLGPLPRPRPVFGSEVPWKQAGANDWDSEPQGHPADRGVGAFVLHIWKRVCVDFFGSSDT